MAKNVHEIRDPVNVFIRLSSDERQVLNSRPFQRLRHIHQLAMTYLIYPGATHRRFEHSLGVMELAGRVFDVVTRQENLQDRVRDALPEILDKYKRAYWRRALCMAALCHDLGHLPFSHAAEKELLPAGWNHERLTAEIVRSAEMQAIWEAMKLQADDVVKLALGPKEAADLTFTTWETILAEIIVGDAFGVDRMDYLLRDAHHVGVAYGKFDHYRLIDTLRILPPVPSDAANADGEPALGVEQGGIQSAEALMLARYFMYSQVYFHHIRRIYDIHLADFLKAWLPNGSFSTNVDDHLAMTDNEVTVGFLEAALNSSKRGHDSAAKIVQRQHFKVLYERNPADVAINPEAGQAIYKCLCNEFGDEYFRHDCYSQKSGAPDFPVIMRDDQIVSSVAISETLHTLPVVSVDCVFAERTIYEDAKKWLRQRHDQIIQPKPEEEASGQVEESRYSDASAGTTASAG